MRVSWKRSMSMILAGLLLAAAPAALAQKKPAPAMPPAPPPPAPNMQPPNQRVVVVEPFFDPFLFDYPYPYAYTPDYMASNFGYVKIKTDHSDASVKDASVYVDGGFAAKLEKEKKFALRPGTHDIQLRDSDGRTLLNERVAVIVGKTTELNAPRYAG